ncbi:hypothetical protein DFH29DRAFT_270503 [Suillus ampliporus]|nr:hypothetical protein DFH29DRAFT_270503 [Suillus ampliporus]
MVKFKQSKNSSKAKQPSSEIKDSQDENGGQLLDTTITAINIAKELVPIDLAKGILGTVANILIVAQSVIKNQSDFQAIVNHCMNITRILERATKGCYRTTISKDPWGLL